MVNLTVLKLHQYCVVVDAVGADGKPELGTRQLRKGPATFFLQPGECACGGLGVNIMENLENTCT